MTPSLLHDPSEPVGASQMTSEGPPATGLNLGPLLGKNAILKGITSGSRRMLEDLLRAVDANGVKPKIDKVFGFGEARAALDYLASGGHIGKIVIRHG